MASSRLERRPCLPHIRIEGLDADREPVRPRLQAGIDLVRGEMDDPALNGDLAIGRERQLGADGGDDPRQFFRAQRRRGAAAEIDGVDRVVAQGIGLRLTPDLLDDQFGVIRPGLRHIGIAVKAAEEAVVGAERDVDIGEPLARFSRLRLELKPDILHLFRRQTPLAAKRHHRPPPAECLTQRIEPGSGRKIACQVLTRCHAQTSPLITDRQYDGNLEAGDMGPLAADQVT